MKLPNFEREPLRPEREPGADNPLWQPGWICFCCHDTGIVWQYLAKLIIRDYDLNKDKFPICQNPRCHAGDELLMGSFRNCLDMRFDSDICQQLDKLERQNWRQFLADQHQRTKELKAQELAIARKMNLRLCDRTSEEERVAQLNHQEVVAR